MNFIRTLKEHFTPDWCKEVIDYFEGNVPLQHKGFLGQDKRIQNTEITIDMRDTQWQPLVDGLNKGIEEYKKDYKHLDNNMSPWSLFVNCQIMRYIPGEAYKYEHCEHGKTSDGWGLSRVIAWQINLNTIENLGGTWFNYYDHTIKPEAGSLSFWPAGWTHMHRGLVSPDKNKYIITGWYNFN